MLPFPKIFTIPPETSCVYMYVPYDYYNNEHYSTLIPTFTYSFFSYGNSVFTVRYKLNLHTICRVMLAFKGLNNATEQ